MKVGVKVLAACALVLVAVGSGAGLSAAEPAVSQRRALQQTECESDDECTNPCEACFFLTNESGFCVPLASRTNCGACGECNGAGQCEVASGYSPFGCCVCAAGGTCDDNNFATCGNCGLCSGGFCVQDSATADDCCDGDEAGQFIRNTASCGGCGVCSDGLCAPNLGTSTFCCKGEPTGTYEPLTAPTPCGDTAQCGQCSSEANGECERQEVSGEECCVCEPGAGGEGIESCNFNPDGNCGACGECIPPDKGTVGCGFLPLSGAYSPEFCCSRGQDNRLFFVNGRECGECGVCLAGNCGQRASTAPGCCTAEDIDGDEFQFGFVFNTEDCGTCGVCAEGECRVDDSRFNADCCTGSPDSTFDFDDGREECEEIQATGAPRIAVPDTELPSTEVNESESGRPEGEDDGRSGERRRQGRAAWWLDLADGT